MSYPLELSKILEQWSEVIVVSDDVYYHLPFDSYKYTSFAGLSEENYKKTVTIFSGGKLLNCTGWKIGWAIGPNRLIKNIGMVHEASCFNNNVPGQVAIGNSLEQTFSSYEGYDTYTDFVKSNFQTARDEALELISNVKSLKLSPT